ncbi:MAG: nicotinate (nicotinamide) nucleotide adenylyltransferase [Alphaproteobacteria bacterium]|jgi:nicotinate (nicotinamide) nucleotide adenylyltransferase
MDKDPNSLRINALFGGTFDPPHLGHLLPLQEIADIAGLSTVSLLPANVPVFKKSVTHAKHRIAMTRLLCELDPRFSIDLTEFSRESVSYTIDTLMQIKQQNPKQPIVFIIGLDSLLTLHLWERWRQLFEYCHIIVMQRSLRKPINNEISNFTSPTENMASKLYDFYTSKQEFDTIVGPEMDEQVRLFLLSKLSQGENDAECINLHAFKDIIANSAMGKLWFIKNQILLLSSTDVRQQIKVGKNVSNLVPTSISDYINKHQLYIK